MAENADSTSAVDAFGSTSAPVVRERSRRDFKFWLVFLAIGIATLTTALELSAVSTALPTIVEELHGSTFVWVGSAYALAATAFIPISGGFAQILGRRVVMLGALIIMIIGSILCGAAKSMNFLIAGRTVQGIGGGGVASITAIIISDLVPLKERGVFNGLIGIAWAIASGSGPIIGGALAQSGQWRWLFYLNAPICGASGILIFFFLRVRTPPGSLWEKFNQVDWIGNWIVMASTTACVIALTWSGVQYSWSSTAVLVPLIIGLVGLIGFIAYEATVSKKPLVPFILMSTITGVSGYLQTFLMPIVMLGIIYYMPTYFQACKGLSPIGAGVDQFAVALVLAPSGIIAGVTVRRYQSYRPQLWISWVLLTLGTGLLILLREDTSRAHAIGYLVFCGIGLGILTTTTYFPVLAPLPISQNALALAFFMFLRNFAQVWGITIGGAVLQNQLHKNMPSEFLAQFPQGSSIAYATIPLISQLPEPLRTEVRVAFAVSLKVVWEVMTGIAGLGLLSSLLMKGLPLHDSVNEEWDLDDVKDKDHERSSTVHDASD
ncbi:MFS general substrate transporter [Laetiporus sulphureus 93-53]|uniref:MFS general substrate transporter n=1 Tax=Laetiporus sulphureus 93-53 TaxID=1314785 RepID=A0A165C1A7_9APHY|nr:MFS general substrate transporter [Laetiporus sulphureus 93-53]KZT02019.1 MFS general substrate transporter [Laetiporus sulphureus 93-53]